MVRNNEGDFGAGKESGLGIRNDGEEKAENQKNEDETRKEHVQDGEVVVNEEEVEEIEREQIGSSNEEGRGNQEIRPRNLEVEERRYFISDNVVNLSERKLTEAEVSLLSKGIKFYPTPRELDFSAIKNDLKEFSRRLKCKTFFYASDRNSELSYSNMGFDG